MDDGGAAATFAERRARLLIVDAGVDASPPLLLFAGLLPSHGDESRADSSGDVAGYLIVDDRAPGPRGVAGDRRGTRPRPHRGDGVRVDADADASAAPVISAPTTSTPPRRHSPMISGDRDTTPAAAASTTTLRRAASSASMAAACSRCHPNRAEVSAAAAAAAVRSPRIERARILARQPRARRLDRDGGVRLPALLARSASARRIARFLAVSDRARAPLACDCSVIAARRNVSSSGSARVVGVDGVSGAERVTVGTMVSEKSGGPASAEAKAAERRRREPVEPPRVERRLRG